MTRQKYQHLDKVDYRKALLAYLTGQGFNQSQAAAKLSRELTVGAAQVARDIHEAEMRRWLSTQFAEELFEQDLLAALREDAHHRPWLDLEAELRHLSGGVLKSIWVFNSSDEGKPTRQTEWDWQMGNFARNSGWFILKLLRSSKNGIALGWGKTIANVIEAVFARLHSNREREDGPNGRKNHLIIPTVGTPPGTSHDELERSSTRLAESLSEALNGTWKNVLSLEGVWPVLPGGLSKDQRIALLKLIRQGSYKMIFGPPDNSSSETPMIRVVDTILTSAGAFHTEAFFVKELINTGSVSKKDLLRLAAGDIGSVLIPREGIENNSRDQERFNQILSLCTGISLADYQDIARRAAAKDDWHSSVGVILCALNGNKAEIVLNLVHRQAVSVLVVDYHLANGLKSLLLESKTK